MSEFGLKRRGKKGLYVCDFVVNGVRIHKATDRYLIDDARADCRRWQQDLIDAERGILPPAPPPAVPTLRALLADWLRVRWDEVSDSQKKDLRNSVELHAGAQADLPADQLTTGAVAEIRAAYLASTGQGFRRGGGFTVRTHGRGGANRVIASLSTLCAWAVETGRMAAHPFMLKRLKVQPAAHAVLWPEQVQKFLEVAGTGHAATALCMMLGLGLREGEAVQADWGWVEWHRHTFVVGGRTDGRQVAIKDKDHRDIDLPHWLEMRLWSLWNSARKPSYGVILPGVEKPTHHPQLTLKLLRKCAAALGITGLTPHSLRRTFATHHFESGTPLSQIQQMLGHAHPETTMNYILQRRKDQAESQARVARLQGLGPVTQKSPKMEADLRRTAPVFTFEAGSNCS